MSKAGGHLFGLVPGLTLKLAVAGLLFFSASELFALGCPSVTAGPDTCPGGTAAECTGSTSAGPYCVFQFGTDSCGDCSSYASDSAGCNDVVRNGGNCFFNGSCCVDGSAPAPELPPGAFWYIAVVLGSLALLISQSKGKPSGAR